MEKRRLLPPHGMALLCAALLPLLLAACVKVPSQESPPKRFYLLEAPRDGQNTPAPTPAFDAALALRDVRVAPPYGGRALTYKRGASFDADYYHLFLAPPGELITQASRRWLADAGVFPYVTLPGSDARYGYLLEVLVTELYGDFTERKGKAVLGLQAFLLKDEPRGPAVVLRREYRQAVELEDNSPEALVAGLNQGLARTLEALSADLRASGPRR